MPPSPCSPGPVAQDAEGVGSVGTPREDEDPLPAVRSPDVGSACRLPRRVIPEAGQVSDHTSESPENRSVCPPLPDIPDRVPYGYRRPLSGHR